MIVERLFPERVIADSGGKAWISQARETWRSFQDTVRAPLDTARSGLRLLPRRRPRVAVVSSLPPNQSDVLAAICAPLGELVEVHLFTETAETARLRNVASIRPLEALPRLLSRFDRILGIAPSHPQSQATVDMPMRVERAVLHLLPPVHRTWDPAELRTSARAAARKRLGFGSDEVAIVVPGTVRHDKAPAECIEATEILRGWGIKARLCFAGNRHELPDRGASLSACAASLEIADAVQFADGVLPELAYRDHLLAGDLALNLRTCDSSGVSNTLLDCAAAGLPAVTNASVFDAAGVPSVFARAVPDHLSPVLIAEALAELHETPSRANREPERRAFCEARSVETYARLLCEALDLPVPQAS